MNGPIAVFGAGGQLGREFLALAALKGVQTAAFTRQHVDIADPASVADALKQSAPRLVVNAAAYTAVDKAESDADAAFIGNATGPGILARATAAADIPLLHFSTDYMFDGAKAGAYVETDPIAPLGVYGRTKAEGEARVRAGNPRHIIMRTSWVYGVHGANFLKTILRLASERDELHIVGDQQGCPTATIDLAHAILAIDRALSLGKNPWGVYHFTGTGITTWYDFANEIIDSAAPYTGRKPAVKAITTADYPTPARRPKNSALDSSRFASMFGYSAAPWQTRTREIVEQLTHHTTRTES